MFDMNTPITLCADQLTVAAGQVDQSAVGPGEHPADGLGLGPAHAVRAQVAALPAG